MVALPLAHHSTALPCFCGSLGLLHKYSWLWITSLLSLQAVCLQPMAVFAPGLLSNTHIPAPSPRAHQWTHIPVWDTQGCGTDHLCRSHSVLSATDRLFHPPPTASDVTLLSQLISPSVRGLPWIQEPLLFLSSPPRGTDPIPLPLLFFFPSSFFCPTRLCRDPSSPFQCPRSSASVQPVVCENCSICRCILDAFVGRDELHILLLLRQLEKPQQFILKQFQVCVCGWVCLSVSI